MNGAPPPRPSAGAPAAGTRDGSPPQAAPADTATRPAAPPTAARVTRAGKAARAARLSDLTLAARLAAVPHRFDGLHALRLAELGRKRAGTDASPEEEAIRLPVVQGLAFASSPVVAAARDDHGLRLRLAFIGLTGPLGVLPQVYAELVQRADRLRNTQRLGLPGHVQPPPRQPVPARRRRNTGSACWCSAR